MITMRPLQGPTWHNSLNTFTFFHASELQLRCVIFCSGNFPRLRAPEPHSTMLLDFRSRPDSPKPLWKTGFVRPAPPPWHFLVQRDLVYFFLFHRSRFVHLFHRGLHLRGGEFAFPLAAIIIEHGPSGLRVCKVPRSEEHTSELQSLMRISSAVFCLNKKNK